jgi:hypothetical protein
LENFDIQKAKCYDPNEEFRLRCIMREIGGDYLKYCFDLLAKEMRAKYNILAPNRSIKVFPIE